MEKNVELVNSEYEFPAALNASLGDCILYLEFFASKSVCAYDIRTNKVRLVRKLQKKLDQLVQQELALMEKKILNEDIRYLPAVDNCSQRLEVLLQDPKTLGNKVIFGSMGIDGVVQTKANDQMYQEHEQVLVEEYQRLFLERQALLDKLESKNGRTKYS